MRNLLIILSVLFLLFTSCNKDDDFAPTGPEVEMEDPITIGEDDNNEDDDNDNNGEDDNDDDDNQDDVEEDDNTEDICFVERTILKGNNFDSQVVFERTGLGRLESISVFKNGAIQKKAEINYRTNGHIRAMSITENGRQSLVSFSTKGLPVDMSTTTSDGEVIQTKYALDDKDRIIKEIVRKDGKTTSERNYIFEDENIVAMKGFVLTSSGVEIDLLRKYKYDEKGLNPFTIDPFLTKIALGENVSKNLLIQMETTTGVQFKAEYELDQNGFPVFGNYSTSTDGDMFEEFAMDCL